ncbi:MAG: CocE/NonD family hydrolase [Pseudomonadota bacterium]
MAVPLMLLLAACGSSMAPQLDPVEPVPPPVVSKPEVPATEDRAGTITNHVLISPVDGAEIPVTVFEPIEMKKGGRYPLVIYSHGWSGSRATARDFFTNNINERGMYALTFDQRGFGASTGMVKMMDPDYDGQDMVAILDWAEKLPGLARFEDGRMKVGSVGGSYGGMFQYAMAGSDPEHRLRVIVPDVTPYDINEALWPGDVFKSAYGAVLLAGTAPPLGKPDPITDLYFASGLSDNRLSESLRNYARYHSLRYFCEGLPPGPQSFMVGTADTFKVPPGPLPKIDALITQGFRDVLFNFNHAVDTYDCLRQLGGDVRLFTHQSGHLFNQLSVTNVPGVEQGLDPLYALVSVPNSGDVGGNHQCGTVNSGDVTWAYFEEKLQGKVGAIDAASKAGRDVCMSLGQGDAIAVKQVKEGGTRFAIDGSTPQFSGVPGAGTVLVGEAVKEMLLTTQILYTAPAEGAVLAGIPTVDLKFTDLAGATPACSAATAACDPILFLGIGWRKAGQQRFDLIDDQLQPLRGFGAHSGRLVGVAERLAPGDELALLIYGSHPQFPVSNSRDAATPALNIEGSVALPLLAPSDILRGKDAM